MGRLSSHAADQTIGPGRRSAQEAVAHATVYEKDVEYSATCLRQVQRHPRRQLGINRRRLKRRDGILTFLSAA